MRFVVLAGLCGCNPIWNIGDHEITPIVYDAPLDAPFTCPTTGVPTFHEEVHQLPAHGCTHYVPAENQTAMGLCNGMVSVGDVDGMLGPVTFEPPLDLGDVFWQVRLAPEGDFALAWIADAANMNQVKALYLVDAETHTWRVGGSLPVPPGATVLRTLTTPSRRPNRHVIVAYNTGSIIVDMVGDNESWIIADTFTLTELGAGVTDIPALTADGMSLLGHGSIVVSPGVYDTGTLYWHRDALDTRFSSPTRLTSVPDQVLNVFMTPDCGRLYFNALDTIMYYQQ